MFISKVPSTLESYRHKIVAPNSSPIPNQLLTHKVPLDHPIGNVTANVGMVYEDENEETAHDTTMEPNPCINILSINDSVSDFVADTPTIFTSTDVRQVYDKERQCILDDAEVTGLLDINSKITGFCNHPMTNLKLRFKPFPHGIVPKDLCRSQYRIPEVYMPAARKLINRIYQEKKIIDAPPGTPYNTPLLFVPKKDNEGNISKDDIRGCLDFRPHNELLEPELKDQFQLPRIKESIQIFEGCTIFGEFDLAEAFYQFKLDEESRPFTAFTFEGKQYMCAGIPFGLSIVPSHFQRAMSIMLQGIPRTLAYIDNIPFGSTTWEEHRDKVCTIIKRLNHFNLRIKPSSIKIGHSHMRCLGQQLSMNGIGLDPKKKEDMINWPRPTTGKDVMAFLGFVTFMRDHIRHVAEITGPLEAIKNHKILIWSDTLETCFQACKAAVAKAPFMKYPDFTRPFHIATDASNTGVGGVLFQPSVDDENVTAHNIVALCSKKLGTSQRNYSAYKKELYGILYCLKQFRPYVWGRNDLVIYTDHKPLTYILQSSQLSTTIHGWLDDISDYHFTVRYRPGELNILPDALSRKYSSSDTWGVCADTKLYPHIKFDIPEVNHKEEVVPKDITGTLIKNDGVSIPNNFFQAIRHGEEDTQPQAPLVATLMVQTEIKKSDEVVLEKNPQLDLLIELEKRGMTSPPTELERTDLIEREHALGHFGIDAIYKSIYAKGIWWPKMRDSIKSVIQDCHSCNVFTVIKAGYNPAGFIHAEGPWQHIQIDTSVHMPPSPTGYTTLLVIIDVFTGFVLLRTCKSSSAEEIARKLWKVFCTFGFPKILQSDNGHEFVNEVLRTLVKICGIEHRFISPYNPRADGKVERAIGTIMSVIKKMVHGSNMLWPMYVPFAQYTFNIKTASLTGSAPFSLMFGRAPNEWKDYTQEPPLLVSLDLDEKRSNWKLHQDKMVSLIYPTISQHILTNKNKMVAYLNKTRHALLPKNVAAGTEVYLVDPLKQNKWQPKYIGPYTIIRRAHNGAYVLRDATGDILDRHIPLDQLKVLTGKRSGKNKNTEANATRSDVYVVEAIRAHRGDNPSNFEFFVKWEGYPEEENTWEPIVSFHDKEILVRYMKINSINK